jgi:hypothetical protein
MMDVIIIKSKRVQNEFSTLFVQMNLIYYFCVELVS